MTIKAEAFIALEQSLASRLISAWAKDSVSLLHGIYKSLSEGDYENAVELANAVDLTEAVEKESKHLRYLAYSALAFGASRVSGEVSNGVDRGRDYERWVDKSLGLLTKSVVQNVEDLIRDKLLADISEASLADPDTNYTESETTFKAGEPTPFAVFTVTKDSAASVKAWLSRERAKPKQRANHSWKETGKTLWYNHEDKVWMDDGLNRVSAAEEARLKTVPKGWHSVVLNPDPTGSLIAIGLDDAGREQPKYSAKHTGGSDAEKFARELVFHSNVKDIRHKLISAMADPAKATGEAAALHLVSLTAFRIGGKGDGVSKVKAYGASTLEGQHLKIDGEKLSFSFIAKKGVRAKKTIVDPLLSAYLRKHPPAGPNDRLFNTSDSKVRDAWHSIAGPDLMVKDWRTWHGTYKALKTIKVMKPPTDLQSFKKLRAKVGKIVSDHLGNTPAVALRAYISPMVFNRPEWADWNKEVLNPPKKAPKVAKEERVLKAGEEPDFDDMFATMEEWYSTRSFDETPGDWRKMPETSVDPDEEDDPVRKAEVSILKPFVSFNEGVRTKAMNSMQLVSSLHTSRLSAFGFTMEAGLLGIEKYSITEQLDNRICDVCRTMHGKTFKVSDATSALTDILEAEEPDDLKVLQPWPKQDERSLKEFRGLSNDELVGRNWHLPPYHPMCRGLLVPAGKVPDISSTASYRAAFGTRTLAEVVAQPVLNGMSLTAIEGVRTALAYTAGAEAITAWNYLKNTYPVEVMEAIMGVLEEEVLAGKVQF